MKKKMVRKRTHLPGKTRRPNPQKSLYSFFLSLFSNVLNLFILIFFSCTLRFKDGFYFRLMQWPGQMVWTSCGFIVMLCFYPLPIDRVSPTGPGHWVSVYENIPHV